VIIVKPLSELQIKNAGPGERLYKLFDGGGLYLEVLETGTKSWRFRYFQDGKDRRQTFGHYPDISLKLAREMAVNFKVQLKSGQYITNNILVKTVCNEWFERHSKTVTLKVSQVHKSVLDKIIIPIIGDLNIASVKSADIYKQILQPLESDTMVKAHRVKDTLSLIFNYAVSKEYIVTNPIESLKRILAPLNIGHRATIIAPVEIGELMSKIKTYDGRKVDFYALNLLPYIFVRPGELRFAQWKDFDLESKTWKIPAEQMKMRTPHIVPLSDQVISLLTELKGLTGGEKYLFVGSAGKNICKESINNALVRIGYDNSKIVPHGFRAMASTLLNEQGYNSDWIERQLAHSERKGVRAAYNHAQYLPERRKMMQHWADYLDSLAAKHDAAANAPASFQPTS
jgi:integrase